jgi:hypothetical protein
MTKWIGAAILAFGVMFGGSGPIDIAAAAPWQAELQKPQTSKATDLSARRRAWRRHPLYVDRLLYQPYYPHYYERPYYYAPAPFVPFNFGYGIWPWG